TGASISVLAVNGEFLKVTYRSGTGYIAAVYADIAAAYQTQEETDYSQLKSGDSGDAVRALQQALTELKFYSGATDGKFSASTLAAVKAFQKKNGYVQTGILTPAQQKLLFEGRPKNASGKTASVKTLPPIDGYPMAQGDKGEAVRALQTALKTLGYYSGALNGVYDSATDAAVKAFQRAKGLTADGKAGDKTQKVINALTSTPTPVPDGIPTQTPVQTPINATNVIVMQNGTRGVAVKNLQKRLVELGYYTCTIDGIFDSNDIAAVKAFQKKNGLNADGIAGLETQLILFSDAALPYATATPAPTAQQSATVTPTPTSTPDLTQMLKSGSKGTEVTRLQERLEELNYFHVSVDGLYGPATSMAVRLFQRQNGLTADGVAGTKTLQAIYSSGAKAYAAAATPTPTPVADTTMRLGDMGAKIKAMQQRLVTLGYMKKADGAFGPSTYAAVLAFQQKNGLTISGEVDTVTLRKLNSSSAKRSDAAGSPTVKPTQTPSAGFDAPKASQVRYANWYTEIRTRARAMPDVTIYDPDTGLHYKLHMFSFGKHADCEPPTAADTAIMNQVCGTNNWTPHAVWVIFSDGRV
ncbi:peptidoglycan-binding protein, partial [Anaerorhabdus sp.]|uniref:peptidoglycan-binding domain-containing protein n=1 Tax=Anaerorhabdus sp. TaxID=1872524 RepID=UPI002B215E85